MMAVDLMCVRKSLKKKEYERLRLIGIEVYIEKYELVSKLQLPGRHLATYAEASWSSSPRLISTYVYVDIISSHRIESHLRGGALKRLFTSFAFFCLYFLFLLLYSLSFCICVCVYE